MQVLPGRYRSDAPEITSFQPSHLPFHIFLQIAVVSIAGPYRGGKSFFLNSLMRELKQKDGEGALVDGDAEENGGFEVSNLLPDGDGVGTEAITIRIIPGCMNLLPGDPETALILVDSPGLFSPSR